MSDKQGVKGHVYALHCNLCLSAKLHSNTAIHFLHYLIIYPKALVLAVLATHMSVTHLQIYVHTFLAMRFRIIH
jgi:hypothetical protein